MNKSRKQDDINIQGIFITKNTQTRYEAQGYEAKRYGSLERNNCKCRHGSCGRNLGVDRVHNTWPK